MEGDEKKGQAVPANMEEAVAEFKHARHDRIATRRARIAEKIAAAKNAEAATPGDTASVPSSLEFLEDLQEKSTPGSRPGTTGGTTTMGGSKADKSTKKETKKSQSATEQLDIQIEESRKQLEQMILDGEVLITNVKVAAEYREKVRQKKQNESHKERLARLRQESEECQEMYKNLSQNWEMKAEKALPMDLFKQMKTQQDACNELLAKKDDLIIAMRREVEENDFEYDNNMEKYQKDSMLMGDRIDDLVDDLRTAFVEELNLIEDYTCRNREVILEDNQNEWMDLLQDFETMEQKNLEERKSDAIGKFQILNDLYTMTKQEARTLRHKMEDDMRILIQEREQIKYACNLNLEKMAYNLHILQCRSKENVELKNMMKRFLLQLHDKFDSRAANLKRKMELGKKQCEKLIKEIERLESQLSTFGQKTLHLALSDFRKYIDLWVANEDLVREKVKSMLDSEKFVYETQLGIEFPFPDLHGFDARPQEVNLALKKRNPEPEIKSVKNKKSKVKKESFEWEDSEEEELTKSTKVTEVEPAITCAANTSLYVMKADSLEFIPGPEPDPAIQRRLMKNIARVICNQSGFIVEEELRKIINPLADTERNLVNLDATLQLLGITNVEEMQALARYMLKYCKTMKGVMSRMGSNISAGMTVMNVSMTGVIGKAALEDLGSDPNDESHSTDVLSQANSDALICSEDPKKFCDCLTEKLQQQDKEKSKDQHHHKHHKKKKQPKIPEKSMEDANSIASSNTEVLKCSPVCCSPEESPRGSVEEILEEMESDGALEEALDKASAEEEYLEELGEGDDGEYAGPDASFRTSKATCMSWLDSVDRDKIIQNLYKCNEEVGEYEEPYNEEYANMLQPKRLTNADEIELDDEMGTELAPVPSVSADDDSIADALKSDAESKTISIPSYDSSSDASDEFLYIDPEDVVTALKNFIEDYKNRQKVVLPTPEEIIALKLSRIKYPPQLDVAEYWENAIKLLDPKGNDLWDTVQHCFEQYNHVLKERNEFVEEIAKLYRQNYELSHLLQKHLQSGAKFCSGYPPMGPLNPGSMGYC